MEYTQENFIEDYKLAKTFFYRHCSYLKSYKDDIIQEFIICLWKSREKFDSEKGKYSTFAFSCMRFCFLSHFWKKRKKMSFEKSFLSFDFEYEENKESFYIESLVSNDEEDLLSKFDVEYLISCFDEIVQNHKSKTFKKIVMTYLKHFDYAKTGGELGVSRQVVFQYVEKFRKLLRKRLVQDGFLPEGEDLPK